MMKKKKGKLAKKKISFQERKQEAEKWLLEFDAEGRNIIKCYRKKFAVGRLTAVDELQRLGVTLTKEQIEKENKAIRHHQQTIANKKKKRKKTKATNQIEVDMDQDDTFYYIAGYTSGGAPYGLTWDEMELESFEDIEDN